MTNAGLKTTKFFEQMLKGHFLSTSTPPTEHDFGTDTTAPTEGDTTLGTSVGQKALFAGFPTVDVGSSSAETKAVLGTTDLNGNNIAEQGERDSGGNLQSHNVFDAESKTNTDILIFIEKTKLRNKS